MYVRCDSGPGHGHAQSLLTEPLRHQYLGKQCLSFGQKFEPFGGDIRSIVLRFLPTNLHDQDVQDMWFEFENQE